MGGFYYISLKLISSTSISNYAPFSKWKFWPFFPFWITFLTSKWKFWLFFPFWITFPTSKWKFCLFFPFWTYFSFSKWKFLLFFPFWIKKSGKLRITFDWLPRFFIFICTSTPSLNFCFCIYNDLANELLFSVCIYMISKSSFFSSYKNL